MFIEKIITLTTVLLFQFSLNAQDFVITPNVCDSLDSNNYFVHIDGYATFNDSMVFYVELTKMDSLNTSVYSGFYNHVDDSTNLLNYTYNSTLEHMQFDIGTFDNNLMRIRLWTEINGVLTEEIYIQTN